MKSDLSPSRRAWNVIMTALVWAAAVLVIALTVGVIGLVLVRGIPHVSWEFLSTTASVLKGTDGILPAILNTLYVILLTLLIVLPLGVGAAVYLTEYASNRKLIESSLSCGTAMSAHMLVMPIAIRHCLSVSCNLRPSPPWRTSRAR